MISKGIENKIAGFLKSMNGQEGARVGYESDVGVTNSGKPAAEPKTP